MSVSDWNGLGMSWLAWVAERSLVSLVLLALVGVIVLATRRCLSTHVSSRLLLLPLIALVLPVERLVPDSWPRPIPASMVPSVELEPALTSAPVAVAEPDFLPETVPDVVPTQLAELAGAESIHWAVYLMAGWVLLVLSAGISLFWRQRRSDQRLLEQSRPALAEMQRLVDRLAVSFGIRGPVAIRLTARLRSPATTGALRPVIYLPERTVALTPEQLRFVLRHELAHIQRRDVAVSALVHVMRVAWCFHPGVWLNVAALGRFTEYACDEAALARSRGRRGVRAPVAQALLDFMRLASPEPRPALRPRSAVANLLSNEPFMKNRLTRILDPNRAPRPRLSGSSLALLIALGAGTLTVTRAQEVVEIDPSEVIEIVEEEPTVSPNAAELGLALEQATTWLLNHQRPDGRWVIGPDPKRKNQRDHNEVHVAALAIRALLPSMEGERRDDVAGAVDRAAKFIIEQQIENGCFGEEKDLAFMYGHGAAIRALCELHKVWPDDARLAVIQRAVNYAQYARNPYSGWRYHPKTGDNDSKITSMMLLALLAAQEIGIEVEEQALRGGRDLLEQLTEDSTGRTGFTKKGGTMSRFTTKKYFPGKYSEEPTAMFLMVRQAMGDEVVRERGMRRAVELLVEMPPEWSRERGSIDLSYWNHAAQAVAPLGGYQAALWRERLESALLPNRVVKGGEAHWPCVDAWSHPGMECYTTVTAMLALQALR